ncbi:hypothetical protein COLO4_26999 [Corchorus olitorius]|uniref:Uncharacterized protein n=1 Tax=Corchorus olitorius TaxID=93759 RepID=A0A1R3HT84_9ROSI|nr:hypothetical protein COLO4_26999 [Corchorus olitorius]
MATTSESSWYKKDVCRFPKNSKRSCGRQLPAAYSWCP